MSLTDIRERKRKSDAAVRRSVDHSVQLFRARAQSSGELRRSASPRDPDEITALNLLSRRKLLTAMTNGDVHYDAERRVLTIAKYTRSE
ncbi:hypothetical protein [Cohnella cellulosilytica]|uniref:Uncharacterized protein n=1 Tax=Cohnella cellulosilytica TaxID=986710 RepID=A0ABW2FDZ7_9BACL